MTPRRHSDIAESHPVRFYKFVALTFTCITVILVGFIFFTTSKRATITIETKAEPVDATGSLQVKADADAGGIAGIVTSTMVIVESTFEPKNSTEEDGIATGKVTLYNETNTSQSLVQKTRLLSTNGVLFRLSHRVDVPAQGTATAEVYADLAGATGNIGPDKFTIPGLSEEKQKVIYAKSEEAMAGGVRAVGVFGKDDAKKAESEANAKVLEIGKSRISDAYPGHDAVYTVVPQSVEFSDTVGVKVTRSIKIKVTATVVAVLYQDSDIRLFAEQLLSRRTVDNTEIITIGRQAPSVALDEYSVINGTAKLTIVANGTSSLNPESREIEKAFFFGKTKDEVRRYVLSLDHVRGVEVEFSPAWMLKVPQIPEHVSVVVKQVE